MKSAFSSSLGSRLPQPPGSNKQQLSFRRNPPTTITISAAPTIYEEEDEDLCGSPTDAPFLTSPPPRPMPSISITSEPHPDTQLDAVNISPPPVIAQSAATLSSPAFRRDDPSQWASKSATTLSAPGIAGSTRLERMRKSFSTRSGDNSIFTKFEDVQLTDDERWYLNAAAIGDLLVVRQSLDMAPDPSLPNVQTSSINLNAESDETKERRQFNPDCVDYMGRNALHLAVDSENLDVIDLLMERLSFDCIEEALLHAISKNQTKLVKVIIEHPGYLSGLENQRRSSRRDPFFRAEEKAQFSPDITPLILAAHYNNHEIIQMFLARKQTIDRPHTISCRCSDCHVKQNYDSLKRSLSRLNAYRGLASPAYMALSSPDPIMTTFELRQEMKQLAAVEKEFKNEYLALVGQCMDFACEMMDLCRGTQEVESVISEGASEPLARLKMAIRYEEKKFVAHPNCQQHLTTIWYGAELAFLQTLSFTKQIIITMSAFPALPFLAIIYIIFPESKVGRCMRCPVGKFMLHTTSYFIFLMLLAAATFRLDVVSTSHLQLSTQRPYTEDFNHPKYDITSVSLEERCEALIKDNIRPANTLITTVQICLMFWIAGLLWIECKQVYCFSLRDYLLDYYNFMDFSILSLYLASYLLRFYVNYWVEQADNFYNGTARVRQSLMPQPAPPWSQTGRLYVNLTAFYTVVEEIRYGLPPISSTYSSVAISKFHYFMIGSRFEWRSDDPEIVSDLLFAVANVLSFARMTAFMSAFEMLGPLQISLGRMISDICRFMVLFLLVLFAFMVGLHNLYWYYGAQRVTRHGEGGQLITESAASSFAGLQETFLSLFWAIFNQIRIDQVIPILIPDKTVERSNLMNLTGVTNVRIGAWTDTHGDSSSKPSMLVEAVGMLLIATYHVFILIILINMLIAMMSHSFEAIQTDCDVEWRFARTRLWMNYMDEGSTLPVPFNMIPTPKSFGYLCSSLSNLMKNGRNKGYRDRDDQNSSSINGGLKHESRRETFIKKRREEILRKLSLTEEETANLKENQSQVMQRLVKRYLFKLERQRVADSEREFMQVVDGGVGSDEDTSETSPQSPTSEKSEPQPNSVTATPPNGQRRFMRRRSATPNEGFVSRRENFQRSGGLSTRNTRAISPVPAPAPAAGAAESLIQRHTSNRRTIYRRKNSVKNLNSSATAAAGGSALSTQLSPSGGLAVPSSQLDAIQRSLRTLDQRLLRLQQSRADEERKDLEERIDKLNDQVGSIDTSVKDVVSGQDELFATLRSHFPQISANLRRPTRTNTMPTIKPPPKVPGKAPLLCEDSVDYDVEADDGGEMQTLKSVAAVIHPHLYSSFLMPICGRKKRPRSYHGLPFTCDDEDAEKKSSMPDTTAPPRITSKPGVMSGLGGMFVPTLPSPVKTADASTASTMFPSRRRASSGGATSVDQLISGLVPPSSLAGKSMITPTSTGTLTQSTDTEGVTEQHRDHHTSERLSALID